MLRISILGKANLKKPAGIVLLALLFVAGTVAGEERPGFSLTTLDPGRGGSATSITTGVKGLGIMSYIKGGFLRAGRCHNLGCTEQHTTPLDSAGSSVVQTSIAIGSDGLPIISYGGGSNVLKVAHCKDLDCAQANITNIGGTGFGIATSMAIGTDGFPLIAFHDTASQLRVLHCADFLCTTGSTATITTGAGVYKSIAIGADGFGVIAFLATNNQLKVAKCNDLKCTTSGVVTLDDATNAGFALSMVIGTDGRPLISYQRNGNLAVAHCININCGGDGDSITTFGASGSTSAQTSIAIGRDGLGLVSSYNAAENKLKVLHCENVLCNRASINNVDTGGQFSSITIGRDKVALISYINNGLKVAHLSDLFGNPYVRRR